MALAALGGAGLAPRRTIWKAGVATIDITPGDSLWMAGFAARMVDSTRPVRRAA